MTQADVANKLWGFCNTLRHDGIGYLDYIEQLTYLLFLKMADERDIVLPELASWPYLRSLGGADLTDAYADGIRLLGKEDGILGDIYASAQSRFSNPVNLKKLINLIDETEWTALDVDVKAAAFEGLLEKAASEGKKGAGQYFTPRILIRSIVRLMGPDPRAARDFALGDPACGTGGFLVSAYEWLMEETGGALDRATARRVRGQTYFGQDLDPTPRRLALMNMYLHGVEPHITRGDSLYEPPGGQRFDVILTNPPFGSRGANQIPDREDFTIRTTNKQLNFVQHILTVLKRGGRAAVVVPDSVLFEDQAGEVFEILTEDCDLHTVLRLPLGTFTPYSAGTRTNVVFFTKGQPTERTWLYDARANVPKVTKVARPLTADHFVEFERCFGSDPNGRAPRAEGDSPDQGGWLGGNRWQSFTIDEIREREFKIDGLRWLRDDSYRDHSELGDPIVYTERAAALLEEVLEDLRSLALQLQAAEDDLAPTTEE